MRRARLRDRDRGHGRGLGRGRRPRAGSALALVLALGLGGLLAGRETAWSQNVPLRLRSWSIDAGAAQLAGSGNLRLAGTIGQPDAGRLAGERLTLHGGFLGPMPSSTAWPSATPTPGEPTPTSDPSRPLPTTERPTSVPTPLDFRIQDTIVLPRVVVDG